MRRAGGILGVAGVLVGVHTTLAAGPFGVQMGQPLDDAGNILLNETYAAALADTGAGVVRVNFRLGPYSSDTPAWYAAYDGIVDRLRSRGIEIIALMTNEAWPGWYGQWQENSYEAAGGNGWNPYLQAWCNFFLRAATRWQGKIKYWELWNEPDCLAVIYPSNYGALLANAFDLARTANLPVEIISGGVCAISCTDPTYGPAYIKKTYDVSINQTGWFTQMKTKWGTYPLDHIGFHIYPSCNGTLNTSWLSSYFDCVRAAYVQYEGANTPKKLFLTEIGWMTNHNNVGDCYTTEATAASNITAAHNLAQSKSYIKAVTYFFLQDIPLANLYFGVFRTGALTEANKKPGWSTLKTRLTYEGRLTVGGAVNQPILSYYEARGHAQMGNPYDNGGTALVHNWNFGPVQDFDWGQLGRLTVFDSADAVGCAVKGSFWETIVTGNNHTDLEFPLSDEMTTINGLRQNFEGGYLLRNGTGAVQVTLYAHKLPLDNSDSGFTAGASWSSRTAGDAYKDGAYLRRSATTTASDYATWTIPVPAPGYYDVYVRWPTVSSASSTANYLVTNLSGISSYTVDQTSRQARWNRLGGGPHRFGPVGATIRLSSQGVSGRYLLADAVRLVGPVPPARARADFDGDGDVDSDDFGHFQACMSGANIAQADPACQDANLDGDSDVDLSDFGLLQRCFSGPNIIADPNCAE